MSLTMNDLASEHIEDEKLKPFKKMAATVYLCQALTFMLAGFPLLVGVAINFYARNKAQGSWLESHFNWHVQTAWITIAGFALSGFTFSIGIGFFSLLVTIVWLIYRITIGWFALNNGEAIEPGLVCNIF